MIRVWIAIALLAGSWLFGLNYFCPTNPWAWFAAVATAVVLLGSNGKLAIPDDDSIAEKPRRRWPLEAIALVLLLPAVWFADWPLRASPLLIVLGLALYVFPTGKRWTQWLEQGAVAAGVLMLVQALTLELYASRTAWSHELPWPLPDALAGIASLLGIDAVADGSTIVLHSMRQVHRLGATWELLLDPATLLFLVGGYAMLAMAAHAEVPAGRRWSAWIHTLRAFTLVMVCWVPLRAGLMMALYLQRVLRSDPDRPLHAMNHFFSPWMLLALLTVPVLLAWRFVRFPREETAADDATAEVSHNGGKKDARKEPPPEEVVAPVPCCPPSSPAALCTIGALVALAVALFTAAIYWEPVGPRHDGRVMVVERHSNWEPTTKPYDTTWFGEPSGYNYAAIYNYLGQYFRMSRLLENEKIDEATLANCDVLVIKTPTARYSPDEVAAVEHFIEQGGGLLLVGDHTNYERSSTILNDITRKMGFIFRDDLLFSFNTWPYDQLYTPPYTSHPIVQNVGPMDFAVSCSIDPGSSSGRPVIVNTGLWSMGPEYHNDNFHPVPQHCPEMRYGAFVQAWAARHGQGRAVAFTDSTIFSNFCVFQPGKAELMLGMVEWLNHGNPPLNPRPWLILLGLAPLAAGLWMALRLPSPDQPSVGARRGAATLLPSPFGRGAGGEGANAASPDTLTLTLSQGERGLRNTASMWLVLLAAGVFGWVAASICVVAANHWAMPLPTCVRPERCVVIDRTLSTVPLSKGADIQGDGVGYGLLEQWIARLGVHTVRKQDADAFSGDALVVICPNRSVTEEFRDQVTDYVDRGGKLLVIDSPENAGSTANSLLWPFGLAIHHDRAWTGKLTTDAQSPVIDVSNANEVVGGQPAGRLDKLPVAATAKYGKGSVMAIGFGSLWNDKRMGEHWMIEPDAKVKARYEVFFTLLRSFLDEMPIVMPPLKKPVEELPMKESGPAEL